jgi:hypothetical protein
VLRSWYKRTSTTIFAQLKSNWFVANTIASTFKLLCETNENKWSFTTDYLWNRHLTISSFPWCSQYVVWCFP